MNTLGEKACERKFSPSLKECPILQCFDGSRIPQKKDVKSLIGLGALCFLLLLGLVFYLILYIKTKRQFHRLVSKKAFCPVFRKDMCFFCPLSAFPHYILNSVEFWMGKTIFSSRLKDNRLRGQSKMTTRAHLQGIRFITKQIQNVLVLHVHLQLLFVHPFAMI